MADSRFYLKFAAVVFVVFALFIGALIAIQAIRQKVSGPAVIPASTPATMPVPRHGGPPPVRSGGGG